MPTVKQWGEFKKYRDGLQNSVLESEEYKDIQKKIEAIGDRWDIGAYFDLRSLYLDVLQLFSQKNIPPDTIEGCMDWLLTQ